MDLPRKFSEATLADRDQMLEEMFRVLLEFAERSGVKPNRVARVFARARGKLTRSPYRLAEARHFNVMQRLADLLAAWHTEPEYLSSRGEPAPLPLSGAKSINALMARFVPRLNRQATVEWLIAEGVLRRRGTGLLVPLVRTVSFTRSNLMTLNRVPFLTRALLSTIEHNSKAKPAGRETRCERMLTLDRFRVKDLPRFDREVKRLVPMLLDHLELWAAPYLEPEGVKSPKTARVGLEVFSYVEEAAPPKRGRRS